MTPYAKYKNSMGLMYLPEDNDINKESYNNTTSLEFLVYFGLKYVLGHL